MQDRHAWRAQNIRVSVEQPSAEAGAITDAFDRKSRLNFDDFLVDGFQDLNKGCVGRTSAAATIPLKVDRSSDGRLVELVDFASKQLRKASDPATKLMVVALVISESLGRSGGDFEALERRCEDLTLQRAEAGCVQIGALMGDRREGHGKREAGAGGSRHRAVLLKALADWLELAPCALVRAVQDGKTIVWNVLSVASGSFVIDLMSDVGALYEENSPRAAAYLDRLRGGSGKLSLAAPKAKALARGQSGGTADPGGRIARPSWHVEQSDVVYDRSDRIGRGAFGEVFRGRWAGQTVAIKEVRDNSPADADVLSFVLEISLLSGLSHPNIVRFWRGCVDFSKSSKTLLLLTEWMDQGMLSELLHESPHYVLEPSERFVLAAQVGRGTAYLHEVGVLHLDLKSPNVLLNSAFQVKLCDFGLAKVREQVGAHTQLVGVSPAWAPPEMFDDTVGTISEKADVYSFGVIVFEIFTRQVPFVELTQMQMTRAKAKGQMPKFPSSLDMDIADFVRLCLTQRPLARPTMQSTTEHVKQLAKHRNIDLEVEQGRLAARGFHHDSAGGVCNRGPIKSTIHSELEMDVSRLAKLLKEEEAQLKRVEDAVKQKLGADGTLLDQYVAKNIERLGDMKYRCGVCAKLFRGEEFLQKHIRERHFCEMLLGLATGSPPAATGSGGAKDKRQASGMFGDGDIAEESDTRMYTDKFSNLGLVNAQESQSLLDASRKGEVEKVQHCLRHDSSAIRQKDHDGSTPLHLAADQGHLEVVRLLLASAADCAATNDAGLTALHCAAQEGHLSVCEALLDVGTPLGGQDAARNRTALHLAAAGGHLEACSLLLARKADPNARDNDGGSVLHNAARAGSGELCELVLSWGAQVDTADNDGWRPLHEGARWGDGALVEALLQRGADPNAASNDGDTPLHVVPGGYAEKEVVDVLLDHKANVNSLDYAGQTPLHIAVKVGDEALVGILLECSADANAQSKAGATPLDLAKTDEVRWMLRAHKARRGK